VHLGTLTRGLAIGCCGCALLACSEPAPPLATAAQPVIGGKASGPEDDATVQLITPSGTCSGILVAPNLVATARHCIAIADRNAVVRCSSDGTALTDDMVLIADHELSDIRFYVGDSYYVGDDSPELVVAYAQELFSTNSDTICRNDLALVVLDRDLEGIEPVAMRLFSGVSLEERMSVVGYGMTAEEGVGGRHRRDDVKVLDVGESEYSGAASSLVDRTFALGPGACKGDSGGPALAESGAVVGVFSLAGSDDCAVTTTQNVYTQLAPFRDLILEAFDAAGGEPWFEGEPAPGDEPKRSSGCAVGCPAAGGSWWILGVLSLVVLGRRRAAGHRS
jgi:hypothetical protein